LEHLVMDGTRTVLVRGLRTVAAAGLLVAANTTVALSNDNCRRLEQLAQDYAGVQLTSSQKQLKRRLVAWYKANCSHTRSAARS
jgi:hypothetical protein